jgi:hypothetical protein
MSDKADHLVQFWGEAKFDEPPFLHPKDKSAYELAQTCNYNYSEYSQAFKDGELDKNKPALHLGLLPQPYLGDLYNADIVILLLNPGLATCDYYLEENHPDFKEQLMATLKQEKRDHIFLDPRWSWTPGFNWWEKKLREVAKLISENKFGGNYGKALNALATRILSIELYPYHSFEFRSPAGNVPASTKAAQTFARSISEDRLVICTRGANQWRLAAGKSVVVYPPSHARSASLSARSEGGKAILSKFGISNSD